MPDERLVRLVYRSKILERGRGLGRVNVLALGNVLIEVVDEISGIVGSEGRVKLGNRPCSAGDKVTKGTVRVSSARAFSSLKAAKDADEKRGAAANITPGKLREAIAATP